jgi:hypothetical protein
VYAADSSVEMKGVLKCDDRLLGGSGIDIPGWQLRIKQGKTPDEGTH